MGKGKKMKDMTKGSPLKLIVTFAIPMILSGILQQCYNLADSLIAGRFAGVEALAAVGVSTPITMLFVGLGTGIGMGVGVVISQIFGAKRMKELKTSIYTALITLLAVSLILLTVGTLLTPTLLRWMNTPENIFEDAKLYLSIYMFGLPFLFMYNIANSIFNALGDSKKPLYFLIFSTIFNILLDLLFVAKFRWGVAGVAWATFIAQGMAACLAVFVLLRRTKKLEKKVPLYSFSLLGGMMKVGVPTMIQNAIVSIGNLFVSALVNSYGSDFIAGYSAALKINGFFTIVIVMIGNAVATFSGQNIGAGQYDRPVKGLKAGMMINFIYVSIAAICMFLFGRQLVGLFVNEAAGEEVYAAGVGYLKIVVASSLLFIILNNCCAVCRAAGYAISFTSTTLVDLIVRVGSAYLLTDVLGSASLYWSITLGWGVGAVMGAYFFLSGKWKNVKLLKENQPESTSA